MKFLIDSSVFIRSFRGDQVAYQYLKNHAGAWGISYITWGELLQGVKHKRHQDQIQSIIVESNVVWGTRSIEEAAIRLLKEYVHQGVHLFDALIAATALEHGFTLVTYNVKHFQGIDRLTVIQPSHLHKAE